MTSQPADPATTAAACAIHESRCTWCITERKCPSNAQPSDNERAMAESAVNAAAPLIEARARTTEQERIRAEFTGIVAAHVDDGTSSLLDLLAAIERLGDTSSHAVSLREDDLTVEVYRDNSGAGMVVPSGNTQVKITHIPTGKSATGVAKSALQAKASALDALRALLGGTGSQEA